MISFAFLRTLSGIPPDVEEDGEEVVDWVDAVLEEPPMWVEEVLKWDAKGSSLMDGDIDVVIGVNVEIQLPGEEDTPPP